MKPIQGRSLSALRKRLRFLRQLSGLTLQELARSSGVSASQLCEFESGVAGMRPDKLCVIEKVLRRSIRARARRIGQVIAAEQADSTVRKAPRRQRPTDPASQPAVLDTVVNRDPEAGSCAEGGRSDQ